MRLVALLATVFILLGCSESEVREPDKDGNFVLFHSNGEARLLVKKSGQRFSVAGTYTNETDIPPSLGDIAPSSVSGAFKVSTSECGDFSFVLGKGSALICSNCSYSRSGGDQTCPLPGHHPPILWRAIGL